MGSLVRSRGVGGGVIAQPGPGRVGMRISCIPRVLMEGGGVKGLRVQMSKTLQEFGSSGEKFLEVGA